MPVAAELDTVFDTSFKDVQPYNFKISYKVGKDSIESRTSGSSDRTGILTAVDGKEALRKILEKLSL